MKNLNKCIISKDQLQEYIKAYLELAALENGGVDNWEWYGESFYNYAEEEGFNKEKHEDINGFFEELADKEVEKYIV
jgi:hypothetical protein